MKPLSAERLTLLKAADVIKAEGWCQNRFHDPKGGYCAQGAIIHAAKGDVDWRAAADRLVIYLGCSIQSWNDHPGRDAAQVVTALSRAAVHGL